MAKQSLGHLSGGDMRYGVMAILGLALALGGPAEAARNDQHHARAQSRSSAAPARAAVRPGAARPTAYRAAPARSNLVRVSHYSGSVSSRQAVPYRNTALSTTHSRGRLVAMPGYHRAVLRGQSARYAQACTVSRGRRVCGGTRQVAMRWSGGLAPAAGHQSSCPDGTMATLAVGHENVTRCVPL
jgi:hypothetical protein